MPDQFNAQEVGLPLTANLRVRSTALFWFLPYTIHEPVQPLIDPQTDEVVGFRSPGTVWRIYDLEGRFISMGELPLGSPLLDPIDLLAGGLAARWIFRVGGRAAAEAGGASAAARLAARGLSPSIISLLRGVVYRLGNGRPLLFTATTLKRMADPSRYVPVHILRLAIKHGKRSADPRGFSDVFNYTIRMVRQEKGSVGSSIKEYTLKVVVRKSDNTVFHFHFEP